MAERKIIQYKLFQIGGIQTRDKCIYKFLTENKKFQVIISHPVHLNREIIDKETIDKVIEYNFVEGGEKVLNPAGFDFLSIRGKGEFLIFKNKEESFKKIWSEIFTL